MKRLFISLFILYPFFAQAQIANSDFENWYTDTAGKSRLTGWEHLLKNDFTNLALFGTYKSVLAQHGQYALTISRWYNYTWDVARQYSPLSFKPSALSGFYKYTDNRLSSGRSLDTGLVELYLTKWNAGSQQRDTVGSGKKELSLSTTFSAFHCPVTYTSASIPDSILIHFLPSKFTTAVGVCADSAWCSFLTIDNLSLDQNTSVQTLPSSGAVVFPNPASTLLYIDLNQTRPCVISFTDVIGNCIYKQATANSNIIVDVRNWSKGVYFLHLDWQDCSEIIKLIRQE